MKKYKQVLLVTYILIELLAIIFFLMKEINGTTFILLSLSMSLMIALFFWNRYKTKNT